MNTYTVFDPQDETGFFYVWHGGLTVNVWQKGNRGNLEDFSLPLYETNATEVDVFTLDSATVFPPLHFVREVVERTHALILADWNNN